MKVVVTGGSGLIGSRFLELEDKLEILAPSHEEFDVNNATQIAEYLEKEKPEWVLHFAGYTDVEKAQQEEKELAERINYLGTKNLVGACSRFGIRLMYLSTDHVFKGTGNYVENDRQDPVNNYGRSKFLAEQAVLAAGNNHLIVRTSYPYRAKFDGKKDVVRTILERLKSGQEVELVKDQFVTPSFVDEVVVGISKLVRANKWGIYHIAGRDCLSFYQIGQTLCEVFELDFSLIKETTLQEFMAKYNKKAPQPKRSCLLSDKFQKEMLMVTSTFKEGLVKVKSQIEPVQEVDFPLP